MSDFTQSHFTNMSTAIFEQSSKVTNLDLLFKYISSFFDNNNIKTSKSNVKKQVIPTSKIENILNNRSFITKSIINDMLYLSMYSLIELRSITVNLADITDEIANEIKQLDIDDINEINSDVESLLKLNESLVYLTNSYLNNFSYLSPFSIIGKFYQNKNLKNFDILILQKNKLSKEYTIQKSSFKKH